MSRRPTHILGISFGHGDSSACLVVDGKLVAAVEEERFSRVKHYASFPTEAVKYCLRHAGIEGTRVDIVAIARKPMNCFWKRVGLGLSHPELLKRPQQDARSNFHQWQREMGLSKAKISRFEHHYAHMMSVRYLSQNSDLAILSFDGLGDFVSTAIGMASPRGVEILNRIFYPHSLGFFYTAMTQYLGFPYFGDEFKVMGLSSLGEPRLLPVMRNLVREVAPFGFRLNLEAFPILRHQRNFYVENNQPHTEPFYSPKFLTSVLGIPPRKPREPLTEAHWSLAKSVQCRFEEIANHLLQSLYEKVRVPNLAIAGGCAHNSVWVGKIPTSTEFKNVTVAPASHDAGIAVGAAIAASGGPVITEGDKHRALLGPSVDEFSEDPTLKEGLEQLNFRRDTELIRYIVNELDKGKIIGLVHGRLEFGPRALGSRSILADPRVTDMKDRLNARVKHRESFRPFAASVLEEHQDEYFENAFYAPTMEAVFNVRKSMKKKIPGVVHVDGTCRIQSVRKLTQPFYWSLLHAFYEKTGVPMLINTSFNDSEPIVCSASDALKCFRNTELDVLVIEDRVYLKKHADLALTG